MLTVLDVIRMVKLFGWQERMATEIKHARKNELSAIFKFKVSINLRDSVNI